MATNNNNSNTKRVMEASALLLLFSFFALVEGIIRMTSYSKPSLSSNNDNDSIDYWTTMDGTQVPIGIFLIAGCAEVLLGIVGVFIGFSQLVLLFETTQQGSAAMLFLLRTFALVQALCSAFVFGVFVIAAPIMEARETNGVDGLLSQKEHRYMILCGGLLGSVAFCFAVLGGQFLMILRLLAAINNNRSSESTSANALLAVVWSLNQLLLAGSTLYVGIHLWIKDFSASSDAAAPATAVPHFVWHPLISIITGAIMVVYGTMGLLSAYSIRVAQQVLPLVWIVGTLAMMVNFSWTFGLESDMNSSILPATYAAQQAGLVLAVTVLPLLYAWRTHRPIWEVDVDDKMDAAATAEQPLPQSPTALFGSQRRRHYDTDEGMA